MSYQNISKWQIYSFKDNNSNKIWGIFVFGNNYYCFWNGVGNSPGINKHGPDAMYSGKLHRLVQSKINKGYKILPGGIEELRILDPGWESKFEDKFTWYLLQDE